MCSRFSQFTQMRMAYVMEGRIILKYKSRSSRLPMNELLLSRLSFETKLFLKSVRFLDHVSLLSMVTPSRLVWYTHDMILCDDILIPNPRDVISDSTLLIPNPTLLVAIATL